jgi:hypothetical protein
MVVLWGGDVTEAAMPGWGSKCERRKTWIRSSRSHPDNNCVEVRLCAHVVRVRDSKQAAGPMLYFCGAAWSSFLIYLVADDGVPPRSISTFVKHDSPR